MNEFYKHLLFSTLTALIVILLYFIFYYLQYYNNKEKKKIITRVFIPPNETERITKNNNYNNYFSSSFSSSNDDNNIFETCNKKDDEEEDEKYFCIDIKNSVYDARTHKLLLSPNKYKIPKTHLLPPIQSCGFGQITYDQNLQKWSCFCFEPNYFGGEYCDEIQEKLIKEYRCVKVAQASNMLNLDISTFNPFTDGVCVECESKKTQIPIMDTFTPQCQEVNQENEEYFEERGGSKIPIFDKNDRCFYDALSPHLFNSPNNKYIPGYGCVCDYFNGFVESYLPNYYNEEEGGKNIISNACVKIAKPPPPSSSLSSFHITDVAYYTLQNRLKPTQVHRFPVDRLETPFNLLFPSKGELLVKQPNNNNNNNNEIINENDWLNRCIKPNRTERFRRLNFPRDTWPIVHKKHLVNQYRRRNETAPISAYRLATGRGFETKHWYETTNDRFLSNAVWGRPIIYTHHSDSPYKGKVTLNPLGPVYKQYYGLTIATKPGEIVRLDTRGFEQEEEEEARKKGGGGDDKNVVVIPPNYQEEMMDKSQIIYIPLLYNSYHVED